MIKSESCQDNNHFECTKDDDLDHSDCECWCHTQYLIFDKDEVEALRDLLQHQYVSYENLKKIEVTRKIMNWRGFSDTREARTQT